MKIKYYSVLFMLLAASTVSAQSTTNTEQKKNPYTVETNRFWSNWFISAGAGAQIYLGDHDKQMKLGERLSPALDIAVGKWFTPGIGIRFMYSGLSAKGVTQNLSHSNGDVYDAAQALYKQKFELANFHADVLFNLSNLLCGYNEKRFYSLSPYAGLGWMVTWDSPRADEVSASLGFLNSFRLSSRLDLNLDLRGTMVNDRMDGETGHRKEEGTLSATLGLTYKLGRKNWSKVRPMNEAELAEMRQRLQAMSDENDSLRLVASKPLEPAKEKIQVVEKEKLVNRYESVAAPYLVTFPLGKSTLSKEIRVNLGFLAKVIKNSSEGAVYNITGYADKGTGSSKLNEQLSLKRAQEVQKCLVEEHGVEPERLRVVASGGVDNMFYNDPSLSRAVITQVIMDK